MIRDDGFGGRRGETPPPMDESGGGGGLEGGEGGGGGQRGGGNYRGETSAPQGTPEDWAWARQLYDADDIIELPVVGYNRGGLLVEARRLRGFVPISHVVGLAAAGDDAERNAQLAGFVGSRMLLKVIEYHPGRGRIVFSQRAGQAGARRRGGPV